MVIIATSGRYGDSDSRLLPVGSSGRYNVAGAIDDPSSNLIVKILVNPGNYIVPWMSYIAIGQSDADSDLTLADEIHRKLADIWVIRNSYFMEANFGQDEPTGDDYEIKEVGIFDEAEDGIMGQRWVLITAIDKDNIDERIFYVIITFLHVE